MKLQSCQLYHLYNQGNNRRTIFFSESDYRFFIELVKIRLLPHSEVAAWCLMPDHFHFLLRPNAQGLFEKKVGNITSTFIGNGVRLLQSQYGQYLNGKMGWSGSVFRPKAKWMEMKSAELASICFQYIHQNPERSKLVLRTGNWPFSSFGFYASGESDGICSTSPEFASLLPDTEKFNIACSSLLPKDKLCLVRPVFP
jgi:REP element-mobilizing transposase RayT